LLECKYRTTELTEKDKTDLGTLIDKLKVMRIENFGLIISCNVDHKEEIDQDVIKIFDEKDYEVRLMFLDNLKEDEIMYEVVRWLNE
jgi:hypothetical protein